jgi:hypothetical protein
MPSVSESLDDAIETWCGLNPMQYPFNVALSVLWARTGSPSPYDPAGIQALLGCIYSRPVFLHCPQALNMTIGMFRGGGGLQTKSELFLHLQNCQNL